MIHITCERLIFITPSIEKIITSNIVQKLCFSRISQTRSYLKCCYISFNNFLIELLEITDLKKAHQLAFFNPAHDYSTTHCVAIGLQTNDLEEALKHISTQNIHATELYTSKDSKCSKGYRHRTAFLDLQWFGKMVYISEYDGDFFEMRKNDIVTDVEKMHRYSIHEPHLSLHPLSPPKFISFNNGIPTLEVHAPKEKFNGFECDWLVLSTVV